jgi:sugar lactone lactonase YvrE
VRIVGPDGRHEVVAQFQTRPSTFDFLPSGTPIVAFRETKQLIRLDDRSVYADLSGLIHNGVPFEKFGDMVIDEHGRIYIGCVSPRAEGATVHDLDDAIALVDTQGDARLVATGIAAPNGVAISPDGGRLVLAESLAHRIAQWDIAGDGSLENRRLFASVGENTPDGICLDASGAVWVAGLQTGLTVRYQEGGELLASVPAVNGRFTIASMLGGPKGTDLFTLTCETRAGRMDSWEDCLKATGFVEVVAVDTPAGGWPGN